MDAHESTWSWPSAGQEQRFALLDEALISVAERIVAQVWPIVSHPNRYRRLLSVVCSSVGDR